MERISVIVPVYGVEAYLDRCVRSLVEQSYANLEIILVDDGSPDNCGTMCDSWAEKDRRIKVIHKKNGGLSDARNAGLCIATGEYIAFVDSDDWVAENYIEAMALAIERSGAQLAACDVLTVYREDSIKVVSAPCASQRVCGPEEALNDLIHGRGFRAVAWNKLYHRTLLQGVSFPVGKHHEDEFVTYRVLAGAEKLVYVDAPLYFYFQRQGSIMHTTSIKRLDVLDAYLERLCLLGEHFPNLYTHDKAAFCVSCAVFYQAALFQQMQDSRQYKEKIRCLRRRIHFSAAEISHLPRRQLVYVLGTGCCMDLFCRLLCLRKEENNYA